MPNKVLVSVFVITFNHEEFIGSALNSILSQKGDFKIEIIVGDDASSDNTKEIIAEYQKRFPYIIKPFYNKCNVGMMNNFINTYKRCEGDYVAFLEGDDYWVNEYKLQKQLNILQQNPNVAFCFTDVKEVDFNGKYLSKFSDNRDLPENGFIPLEDIIGAKIRKVHIGTILSRNFKIDFPDWFSNVMAGDFIFSIMIGNEGDIYYLNQVTCAYRKHLNGVTNRAFDLSYYKGLKTAFENLNQFLKFKYDKYFKKAIKSRKAQYFLYELSNSESLIRRAYFGVFAILIISRTNLTLRDILWMIFKMK